MKGEVETYVGVKRDLERECGTSYAVGKGFFGAEERMLSQEP